MELRKFIATTIREYLNENVEDNSRKYTMYTGVSREVWENVWKNKNLKDRETNLTTDLGFAMDYSYNFTTGEYEDLVVEIGNIPLDAFFVIEQKIIKMMEISNQWKSYQLIRNE